MLLEDRFACGRKRFAYLHVHIFCEERVKAEIEEGVEVGIEVEAVEMLVESRLEVHVCELAKEEGVVAFGGVDVKSQKGFHY